MTDILTIIIVLLLIYVIYNFLYQNNGSNSVNSFNVYGNNAIVPKRKLTNLEEELRKQYEAEMNEDQKNKLNNKELQNEKDKINKINISEKMLQNDNKIVSGVIQKNINLIKESTPENIQNIEMKLENNKSNFMMNKNMPYLDLENDQLNISLLPKIQS